MKPGKVSTPPSECAFDLEFLYGPRIRSVLVHVDYPRLGIGWVEQDLAEESLGCRCIALGGEQEIDGLSGGIHGSVQVSVPSFYSDIRLIDAIALIGPFQVRAAAPVQFRPVDLHPAPDATGMDKHTAFERHLGHVRKGDRKPQAPPHAPENDIAGM